MFRISAELVANSRAFYNPLRERELDLRANKLVAIENLGTMMDQFDTLDMANNEIKQLGNFPRMKRLTNLVLANNHISLVDGDNLETSLPNLRTLILTNNKIATFARVDAIAKLRSLEFLALTDNPVCRRPKYRLYAIHRMPTVKVLDFRKVAPAERERAAALFASAEGRAMLGAVAKGEEAATIDLSALRAGSAASDSAKAAAKLKRRRIAAAIAAATTSEEVDRLQLQVSVFVFCSII
jgi:U2 small nuclear ribonucleoprotein A'